MSAKRKVKARAVSEFEIFYRSFVHDLNLRIEFHRTNTNDPHQIGTAVMIALHEVKSAASVAHGLITLIRPLPRRKGK